MSNTKSTGRHEYQPLVRVEPVRHRSTYQPPSESVFWPLYVMGAAAGLGIVLVAVLAIVAVL